MYYLQSRYYNPQWGRFVSADGQISGVGGKLLGNNMFAYCLNNPVNMSDPDGNWPGWALRLALTIAVMATNVIAELIMPSQEEHYARNENNTFNIERVDDVPKDWRTSDKSDTTREHGPAANAHQFTSEDRSNVKYVSPDGKQELIFNKNGELVTDPKDIGTYNFGVGVVGHYIMDVKPWIRWGNSPDDTTTKWERMKALIGLY